MSKITERSLIIVKPDGVKRRHVGEVITRIEDKGYDIVHVQLRHATKEQLTAHYEEHVLKPFYQPLLDFMSSGPIVTIVIEGENCIKGFRVMAGVTNPTEAAAGTIRGDFGRERDLPVMENVVHASDTVESAQHEISIWAPELKA